MQEDYLKFCGNIKTKFGLNINPDDEMFPLIYTLITENEKNSKIIAELKEVIDLSLKKPLRDRIKYISLYTISIVLIIFTITSSYILVQHSDKLNYLLHTKVDIKDRKITNIQK